MNEPLFGPPRTLRVPADGPIDYVGRLNDGCLYMAFVTGAFPDGYVINSDDDGWRKIKSWIGVYHLFDAEGNHIRSDARTGGYDISGKYPTCDKAWAELHEAFAPYREKDPKRCDIFVKPFTVVIDGITHGLIYRAVQPEYEGPVVEGVFLEPRDVMFHPPWDSGEWST